MGRLMKQMNRGLSITPVFQWKEWVSRGYAWRNFDVADIAVEVGDTLTSYWEIHFVILGFGVYVDYHSPQRLKEARDAFDKAIGRDEDGTPTYNGERCVPLDLARQPGEGVGDG